MHGIGAQVGFKTPIGLIRFGIGENFAFEDTSDLAYIGMKRNFTSFNQAANEASISRVYGGIHYRSGCEEGAKNGKQIGEYINQKIKLKE